MDQGFKKIHTDMNHSTEPKTLYCIRHGTALHNVEAEEIGELAYMKPENSDAPLVEKGHQEARELGRTWSQKNSIKLILISPLTRTLQTASNIFSENTDIPMIALDLLKEFPQGLHICNKRKNKSELAAKYEHVDFSMLTTEQDEIWRPNRLETVEEISERADALKDFILSRSEKKIVLVSHSAFLNQFIYERLDSAYESLRHCFPYELILE